MSVIQKIQEKYAKLMAVIIAIALITFVVMLAFENGGNIFSGGGNSTDVGKVNGKTIDYNPFMRKVELQEKNLEAQYAQYGGAAPPGLQQQAIEQAWNQEVNEILQNEELQELGIKVGKKEMGEVLYGPGAPDDLKRLFTDKTTGLYNAQQAKTSIDQLLRTKKGTPEQMEERERFISYINYLEYTRLTDKYNSLFINSMNVPKWFIEKENADRSQLAKISFVRDPYAANTDSTIKVSDKEIEDYINAHKDEFKQVESRSIAYVSFSALPSAADSLAVKTQLLSLKTDFDTTKTVATFLGRNGSAVPYSDIYAGKSMMQMVYKDSIQALPVNGVFGPYLDGSSHTLAKMLDIKQLPDSVKCRHVLISTDVQQGGFEDSVASKKIDSIKNAISAGADWAEMVEKYNPQSDGSRQQKGEMTFSSTQIQDENFAKEFAQFILFDGKPGDKKVVKTQFGWHYIDILSFIKIEPHYKVAYMAKNIEASQETVSNAQSEAALFAGNSRDQKSFDANAEKLKAKGINKVIATDIQPTAYQVQGLGLSRDLVKKIYKADVGEVLDPESVGDSYVVAVVTAIHEEGTSPVVKARPLVEADLRKKKIAAKLIQKIGTVTTPEAAAAAMGGKLVEIADSLRMTGMQSSPSAMSLGAEPRVIGASFNPANRGKVVPQVIEGVDGVYVLRVDNVMATPVGDANVAEQRKSRYQQAKQMFRSPLEALRESANIKDRRSSVF